MYISTLHWVVTVSNKYAQFTDLERKYAVINKHSLHMVNNTSNTKYAPFTHGLAHAVPVHAQYTLQISNEMDNTNKTHKRWLSIRGKAVVKNYLKDFLIISLL
jgi:hypothetical protein